MISHTNIKTLYNRLDKKYTLEEQLANLAEISQYFSTSLNIQETLKNAIQQFLIYLDAEAASIFLLENDDTELVCMDCAGPVDITGLRLKATAGIVGHTVISKESQMVRDVSKDKHFAQSVDKTSGFVTKSIMCAPMIVHVQCSGALPFVYQNSLNGLFDTRDQH